MPLPTVAEVLTALQNGTAPPLPIPGNLLGAN